MNVCVTEGSNRIHNNRNRTKQFSFHKSGPFSLSSKYENDLRFAFEGSKMADNNIPFIIIVKRLKR